MNGRLSRDDLEIEIDAMKHVLENIIDGSEFISEKIYIECESYGLKYSYPQLRITKSHFNKYDDFLEITEFSMNKCSMSLAYEIFRSGKYHHVFCVSNEFIIDLLRSAWAAKLKGISIILHSKIDIKVKFIIFSCFNIIGNIIDTSPWVVYIVKDYILKISKLLEEFEAIVEHSDVDLWIGSTFAIKMPSAFLREFAFSGDAFGAG